MRIYCPPEQITQNKITILEKGQIRHLKDVMRLNLGDSLCVFDGNLREYECVIAKITKGRVELAIRGIKKTHPAKGSLDIALACAIPRKAKIEYIIEKATELGVEKIIPLQTERTIVRISPTGAQNKLRHWLAIAKEASKQCGRIKLTEIEPITLLREALSKVKDYDLALIPYLGGNKQEIKEVMANFSGRSVIAFIGPEGDFSGPEIRLAKENGCVGVSLGESTLKVDTAAIALAAYLRLGY
jgi:16S rRNA (uracil1498-N3)-methyltransferase